MQYNIARKGFLATRSILNQSFGFKLIIIISMFIKRQYSMNMLQLMALSNCVREGLSKPLHTINTSDEIRTFRVGSSTGRRFKG